MSTDLAEFSHRQYLKTKAGTFIWHCLSWKL